MKIMSLSWQTIVDEAKLLATNDPFLLPLYQKLIISRSKYSEAMSAILASHFKGSISEDEWYKMLCSVFNELAPKNGETKVHFEDPYEFLHLKNICEIGLYDLACIKDRFVN